MKRLLNLVLVASIFTSSLQLQAIEQDKKKLAFFVGKMAVASVVNMVCWNQWTTNEKFNETLFQQEKTTPYIILYSLSFAYMIYECIKLLYEEEQESKESGNE